MTAELNIAAERPGTALAVIVLTWNQRDLTLLCLDSLVDLPCPVDRLHLIVVDNGSGDGTAQAIRQRYPAITVLETGENLGYAGGNNVGIRYALAQQADYICILNNDVLVTPDFFKPLLNTLQTFPNAGVVSPLVADAADPERVWALGAGVNRLTGNVPRLYAGQRVSALKDRPPFVVKVASGAAMLIKKDVFAQVGLLDESFYLYYEEADWCLRVRQAGYQIFAVPAALVFHKVSATLGATSPIIDYYMTRNQLRLISRHWAEPARSLLQLRCILRTLLAIAAYTAKSHHGQRLPHRNARLLALRDTILKRGGKMGADVAAACTFQR